MSRPLGKKDTKKHRVTPLEKEEIKLAYINGATVTQIKEKFKLSSLNSFYRWASEEDWHSQRDAFFKNFAEANTQMLFKQSLSNAQEALDNLEIIKKKSIDSIKNDKVVPRKFGETNKSYIAALDMERRIRVEGLALSFINELANVLREEITDTALMKRIIERLRKVYNSYQEDSLQLPTSRNE
jgi:hypothetical protein